MGTYEVIITLAWPPNTARLLTTAPATIKKKASQAIFGVARRHLSSVDEQKYNTATSKKMIQKINILTPWKVSNW